MKIIKNIAKNFIDTINFMRKCRRIAADEKRRRKAMQNEEYDILYLMSITD